MPFPPTDSERVNETTIQVYVGLITARNRIWVVLHPFSTLDETALTPDEYQNDVIGPIFRAADAIGLTVEWLTVTTLEVHTSDSGRVITQADAYQLETQCRVELEIAGYLVIIS